MATGHSQIKRLLLLAQRAIAAWRIASLEAEYSADREAFHNLSEKLSADRRRIALARQRFTELGGYIPSAHQVPRAPVIWLGRP